MNGGRPQPGRTVTPDSGPGAGWPEDRSTLHRLENRGTIPAAEISVGVVRQEPP
jgi:hypothetical protein